MKKTVAKTYSIEKIADIYLAVLVKDAPTISRNPTVTHDYALPEILRNEGVYFDEEIIAGAIQLLVDRKYILETGEEAEYTVTKIPGEIDLIVEGIMTSPREVNPLYIDFQLTVKYFRITASGTRFVRLGQVIDVQGKIEREVERKKWKERWITSAIALAASVFTMLVKWFFFDK
jgi:hypothetical protein